MTYQDIKGWFDFEDLYDRMVVEASDNSHFVEVGSCFGKSTAYLARKIIDSGKDIRLDAVDLWSVNFAAFFRNMVQCEVAHVIHPRHMPSHFAAYHYKDESLDFVFIDAEHSYEEVCRDIVSWIPKVKQGGYIGGHDYHMKGVKKAVDELIGEVEVIGKSWLRRKQ